ncbi:hypothetical protein GCM10010409_33470 [Mycolicibacterium diernhoferi]|uniref:SGNH/GDSL hydrolase family protein n=2 Tax=Mycolicibacterium diernhoferi TaxID=1801 RepID=A0A2A7P0P3_9MYCO|nr:SGNH/GDSL hydrolase family protein [Mycolicibacterium diernhoferi]
MADVWYVGPGSSYTITTDQWAEHSIVADTVIWTAANGWSIPESVFSSRQLALLSADRSFVLGQNGPRLHPSPTPVPLGIASLQSAHAYYAAIRELVQTFESAEGLEATARKVPLASYMRPMSKTPYPATDVAAYTVDTTDPAYSDQRHYFFKDTDIEARWRFNGSWFDAGNNPVNQISGGTPSEFNNATSYEIEFYVSGDRFAFALLNTTVKDDFRIFVDDMPLTAGWDFTASGLYSSNYAKVQFATSRVRKVRLLSSGLISFTGVLVPGAAAIWAAPPRFRVAVVGDSYVQGGFDTGSDGWLMGGGLCNQLAILTGWEVLNLGQSNTGYVNDGGGTIGKSTYGSAARLEAMAALPPIDLVIIFGSANDTGYATGTVVAAAGTYWSALKTAHPNIPIVVVGVESGSLEGFSPTVMDTLNTALINAAMASNDVAGAIDMRTTPWVTGTGIDGSPEGDGNADFFISNDGRHPTRAGAACLAERITSELSATRV